MTDVCIIYARKDASAIPPALEAVLCDTNSVWWADKISSGDYRQVIENELKSAGCVIPIWSVAARESLTLHDELEIAREAEVPIVPVRIHEASAPLGYGSLQALDLLRWDGNPDHPEVPRLKRRIAKVLEERRAAKHRPEHLGYGESTSLPVFFYSVSSHETELTVPTALNALSVFGVSTVLISAYDMVDRKDSKAASRLVDMCRKAGALVLLDSGNYEKTRRSDTKWTYYRFRAALKETPHDLAFCYDKLFPPPHLDEMVRAAVQAVERDEKLTKAPMLPIVHLPRSRDGDYQVGFAPELVRRVSEELKPPMIAIPERELGPGVFARAATMAAIRQALHSLYYYQPVHILGTGNPISIALLAAAGADSFDGLEWCRFVVDANSATLHHFQHFELFKYQAEMAHSQITAKAVSDDDVNYAGKTVFHNLDFYELWFKRLRFAVRDEKRLVAFLTELLPKGTMDQARQALPKIL